MPQYIFADAIQNISLHNGLIRIELGVSEAQPQGAAAKVVTNQVLVMPLEGFVTGARLQQSAVKQLAARQAKLQQQAQAATEAAKAEKAKANKG